MTKNYIAGGYMITDQLTIYSQSEDVSSIRELVLMCADTSDINSVPLTAFGTDASEAEISENTRCVVLPYGLSVKTDDSVRKLTYSVDATKGDICALNIQKRTQNTCFEVLYGVFMSRVFIPNESKFTPQQVILAISILCGFGASIDKLIPLINEKLK